MDVSKFVGRLTNKITELGYTLTDLEAVESWKVQSAQRSLPLMVVDVRHHLTKTIDDAPDGFYLSLEMIIEKIDRAEEIISESIAGKDTKGFAVSIGQELVEAPGFISWVKLPDEAAVAVGEGDKGERDGEHAATTSSNLTPLFRRLLDVMLKHKTRASYQELRDAWIDDVEDATITKTLKRLRTKLPRSQWYFEISESNYEIIWHKKGQSVP